MRDVDKLVGRKNSSAVPSARYTNILRINQLKQKLSIRKECEKIKAKLNHSRDSKSLLKKVQRKKIQQQDASLKV